jgi:uncharacterized protein YyaL (SSP411 family)
MLQEIARVWRDERDKVERSASSVVERLQGFGAQTGGVAVPGTEVLDATTRQFGAAFDARRGGFGDAPKFPRPSELLFLLREHARTGQSEPRDMVLTTLRAMAVGGMRDHIGGGFHRYSVDGDWRVPHFEKMLYDQAQLVLAYLEAAQLTGDDFYARVSADTLDYVLRDLADEKGGFFSAEDADSIPPEQAADPEGHKSEGAFYIWQDEEIGSALGEDADIFRLRYGVLPDGNAPFDPQQEFTHKNLLYTALPVEEIASRTGRSRDEVERALERARWTLLAARARRPRPHLDDKVLTAWNGLMIAALARASRVLEDGETYLAAARRAAAFIHARLWNGSAGTLLRRYRRGDAGVEGYAEDYAYLIYGLLELFQADGDPRWLEWALTLQQRQDDLFWDPVDGAWYSTTGRDASVLLRLKEDYDGAEPAASSISVLNLLTMSHLTADAATSAKVEKTLAAFAGRAAQMGRAVPMMLAALSTYRAGMPQLVVVGADSDARALLAVARERYRPNAVVIRVDPLHRDALARLLPWTAAMTVADGRAAAYLCRDFACDVPATSPEALRTLWNSP